MNSTEKLHELRDRFHSKVVAHRLAYHLHTNPDQKNRNWNMWKYNFHIFMMLHVFCQRRAYARAQKRLQRIAN